MSDEVTICSMNVRGLTDDKKRRDVFHWLQSKKCSIYCIQDFHGKKGLENTYSTEWGYKAIFNIYCSNSRGVALLFNNNFEYTIHEEFSSQDGNILAVDISIYDQRYTQICLYGPNRDSPEFYENIIALFDKFENASIIVCGDWNLVLDYEQDTKGYLHKNNPQSREKVLEITEKFDLRDIWRVNNENKKKIHMEKKLQTNQNG